MHYNGALHSTLKKAAPALCLSTSGADAQKPLLPLRAHSCMKPAVLAVACGLGIVADSSVIIPFHSCGGSWSSSVADGLRHRSNEQLKRLRSFRCEEMLQFASLSAVACAECT